MARLSAVLFALIVAAAYLMTVAGHASAQVDGRALYLRDCAFCHSATGQGTKYGPSLQGVGRAAVDYYVSTGRMPLVRAARTDQPGRQRTLAPGRFALDDDLKVARHTPPYTADELHALVDYASSLTGGGPSLSGVFLTGGDVSRGGEIFRLNCAACHSWAGEGGALLHVEAPALRAATARQTAEAVRVGPGNMPAFGTAALTDGQLADLVAYVHQLQHPVDPGGSALWHLGPVAEGAVALLAGLGALVGLVRWMGERG